MSSAFVPFSKKSKLFSNSSPLSTPLLGQVCVIWLPLPARETGKVKFKCFSSLLSSPVLSSPLLSFPLFFSLEPIKWKAEGRRDLGCLLGQPTGNIYATGSKWLRQLGHPGSLFQGLQLLTIGSPAQQWCWLLHVE